MEKMKVGYVAQLTGAAPAPLPAAVENCTFSMRVWIDAAELAALRKDAARYRWLRDRAYFDGAKGLATAWCVYGTWHADAIPTHSEDLDAAIDARMDAAPAVGAALGKRHIHRGCRMKAARLVPAQVRGDKRK